MTDDQKPPTQRINRKNRKDKIEVDHSRFMPKDVQLPDLSELDIPDLDAEALESLKQMDNVMRPLVVTPQEERYPPLPSDVDDERVLEAPPRKKPVVTRAPHARRNNLMTALFTVLTVGVCGFYALIWVDPQTPFNLLAPPTPFQVVTATVDPNPVFVPTAQPTLAEGQPTMTPSVDDLYPFAAAPDGVVYVANQNGRACNWASIGGEVTNSNNEPLPGFGIRVSGDGVSATVYSGTNNTFGAGGYELNLGGAPMVGTFTVQLVTTGGAPLSPELRLTTRENCNENVAIVNFTQR